MTDGWFQIPIYSTTIDDKTSFEEVESVMQSIDIGSAIEFWGDNVQTSFQYNNYDGTNVLKKCPTLNKIIEQHINMFADDLDFDFRDVIITQSWINITEKNQFQHFHSHPPFDVSGVFYYSAIGDGTDGEIVFKHPSLAASNSKILDSVGNKVKYKAEKGKLLLFPSFLEHAVNLNLTNHKRISLTFNAYLNKRSIND